MPESVLYAYDLWDQNYVDERTMPSLSLTAEEMELYGSRYTDISTYTAEMAVKFITGQEDLETGWDNYLSKLEKMGLEEVLEIYENVYDG